MRNFIFLLVFLIGCQEVTLNKWQPKNLTDAKAIASSLDTSSEEEKKTLYKQYTGIVECLKNCDTCFTSLLEIEETMKRLQADYKYSSNPSFVKSLDLYLSSKGIMNNSDSKDIVDNVVDPNTQISRSELIDIMQTIADGARLALETKDESR